MSKNVSLPLPGIPVTVNIPLERLVDYIGRANIVYWAATNAWYPKKLILRIRDSEDDNRLIALGPDDWARGLGVMLEKFPHKFADIVNDDGDMYTGDLLIQCAAFGDEKYA